MPQPLQTIVHICYISNQMLYIKYIKQDRTASRSVRKLLNQQLQINQFLDHTVTNTDADMYLKVIQNSQECCKHL